MQHIVQLTNYNNNHQIKKDEVYLKKSKKNILKLKEDIEVKKEALSRYNTFIAKKPAYKCHLCTNKVIEYKINILYLIFLIIYNLFNQNSYFIVSSPTNSQKKKKKKLIKTKKIIKK